jgi:glycine/D-amino acid oxidase-like deaminating enzyme
MDSIITADYIVVSAIGSTKTLVHLLGYRLPLMTDENTGRCVTPDGLPLLGRVWGNVFVNDGYGVGLDEYFGGASLIAKALVNDSDVKVLNMERFVLV